MKQLLKRLARFLAYFVAAVVILLAVAVGLFRLLLPQLPEYQDEIKEWARAAIGMQVEFTGMNARWRLSGPEVNFYNAKLLRPDGSGSLLDVDELSVSVGLIRLLIDRELVVDRIAISDTSLDLRQAEDGAWMIQGVPINSLIGARDELPEVGGAAITIVGENIDLDLWPRGSEQAVELVVDQLQVKRNDVRLDIDITVELPNDLGERIEVSANQRLAEGSDNGVWQLFIEGRDLKSAGWSRFQPPEFPKVLSGQVDLSLWLEISTNGARSATANVVVSGLRVDDAVITVPFDIQGRFEYSRYSGGWLFAADGFRLQQAAGEWPNSFIRADVATDESGNVVAVDANASFINLGNLELLSPWLRNEQRSLLEAYGPSGLIRRFELRLADLGSDSVRFDLSAEVEEAGFNSRDKIPGISGFSGQVRADRSGGSIEIESTDLRVDMPAFLFESIEFDDAVGTVIWRRNNESTIILSDSVHLRNADIDARSSLQISLPADGGSPLIDVVSDWNITDVSAVSRYIPGKIMKGSMYEWFDSALVAGRISRGTTRLTGPLDKFPFDDGEGIFLIEAHVEDATLKYHPSWPALEQVSADINVDKMRFYSDHNTATTLGNESVDGKVEIADLRLPVLTIDAFSVGTLETILQFSANSPIRDIFGGQLDRVKVDGEASFDLQLRYPLRDKLAYTFSTNIRTDNGRLEIDGFAPPITELTGSVTVTRDTIQSEGLSARFLGEPVRIDLTHAAEDMPMYAAVATTTGTATADALIEELGIPLRGLLGGSTRYSAKIMFPRGKIDTPVPLRIAIDTNLNGIGLKVPAPLAKTAGEPQQLAVQIEFPEDDQIESVGSFADDIQWKLSFRKEEEQWDFDRGVIALGGAELIDPETRGLHIVGETPEIKLTDWLETSPQGSDYAGSGERIRSIELIVDDIYVIGQHLSRHRVKMERGAQEWFIEVEGEQAIGTLVIPYDFAGDIPLVVDMQRLILPGSDSDASDDFDQTDPRSLPPISVKVQEFSLGERHFGSIEAEFARTVRGLEAASITTRDESFEISGGGRWVVAPQDEEGYRSYLTAKLVSSDIRKTTRRLNYEPGVVGNDMEVEFDVSWPGGPREDILGFLDGEIGVRFGSGQLDDVNPGAGRVFGLMSVVALPRRLSLDFRDVFAKGFGFDEITGDFRIAHGTTFTCNLTLKGPAADIAIIGEAGLESRDYNQTAIVNASVGDTLPIVGALAAGPQVAAALLIFSQIFKKPLQGVGQLYYSIQGSWDEPVIATTNAEAFAAAYDVAGCPPATE